MYTVNVYRCNLLGDCTNGGASATADTLRVYEDQEINSTIGAWPIDRFRLVERGGHKHIQPIPEGWYMHGGNFCRDSAGCVNFSGIIAIHDRKEW